MRGLREGYERSMTSMQMARYIYTPFWFLYTFCLLVTKLILSLGTVWLGWGRRGKAATCKTRAKLVKCDITKHYVTPVPRSLSPERCLMELTRLSSLRWER
jgi:hypothetical protein